jgi:hypothetical protein
MPNLFVGRLVSLTFGIYSDTFLLRTGDAAKVIPQYSRVTWARLRLAFEAFSTILAA